MKARIPRIEVKQIRKSNPKIPLPFFAQWGYYGLISLALLVSTIQKANGINGWKTPKGNTEQVSLVETCQIPQAKDPVEKSSCGPESSSARGETLLAPPQRGQLSSNNPKPDLQLSNWN